MRIVITDGYTLNPGDLNWKPFHELGDVEYFDRSSTEETLFRCRRANVIVTNKTPISEEVIREASDLRLIAVTATGYNVVDTIAARKRNIAVCNVPIYGTDSVAQHAIALLLELTNQVGLHVASVRSGEWFRSPDWSYSKGPILELSGKTLGIIGFGRIGQQVAIIARALGMDIVYFDVMSSPLVNTSDNFERLPSLKALISRSDVITLHCPLTKDNQGLINKNLLAAAKPGAYLINTSRGQLINEADLADALRSGIIAGAALDVLTAEPPPEGHPLIGIPNCLITPHIAWLSREARGRIMGTTLENVRLALEGHPQNVVNPA